MKLDDGRWPAELQKSVVLPQFLSHILPCSKGLHPTQLSTTTFTQHGTHSLHLFFFSSQQTRCFPTPARKEKGSM